MVISRSSDCWPAASSAAKALSVNLASVSSWMPVDSYAGYGATKAAVAALTRSAALHCRKQGYGIRVNSVHPDGIYTPMMAATAPGVTAPAPAGPPP